MKYALLLLIIFLGASSCQEEHAWPADKQEAFLETCGAAMGIPEASPDDYCHCVLDGLMERFPDSLHTDNMPQGVFNSIALQCLKSN